MRRRFYPIFLVLFSVLVLLGQASAAPTPARSSKNIFHRQANGDPLTQPFTMQTVQTTQTSAGPVTETCTITFTPVTGSNGESLVQVVRACTLTAGAPPPPGAPPGSTTSSPPPGTTSTSTSTSTPAPPQTPVPPPPATSPVVSTPPPSVPSPVFSSVPLPSNPIPSSPPLSSTTPGTTGPTLSSVLPPSQTPQSPSPADNGTVSPDTVPDTTPAPAASSTAQGAFQIPGKKISVLPIGLGIFAGISVIALIVVGLVTYERTKYRKIFRQRKLAEQGYGGMGS